MLPAFQVQGGRPVPPLAELLKLKGDAANGARIFTNDASFGHNFTIAKGGTVVGATPTFQGGSKTLTVNLKPGTYTYYCSVPGHEMGGMKGTLTVS